MKEQDTGQVLGLLTEHNAIVWMNQRLWGRWRVMVAHEVWVVDWLRRGACVLGRRSA